MSEGETVEERKIYMAPMPEVISTWIRISTL